MTTPINTNELLQLALQLQSRGEAYVMVTVTRAVSPTSAYVGAQGIVKADGSLHGWIGGGCAKSVVVRAALHALDSGSPKRVRISNDGGIADADVELHNMPCASNGEIELFIHPQISAPLLLVLGNTPAANAARDYAKQAGFRLSDQAATQPAIALVATQGDGDEAALEAALNSSATQVLMIASARKAEKLREVMRMRGISETRLAALQAPAGPDIGATTPEEIALAAVAGAVAIRRSGRCGREAAQHSLGDVSAVPITSVRMDGVYVNPVCGIVVDPAKAMHTVAYQNEKFYFCCNGCKVEFERDPAKYADIQAKQSKTARVTL